MWHVRFHWFQDSFSLNFNGKLSWRYKCNMATGPFSSTPTSPTQWIRSKCRQNPPKTSVSPDSLYGQVLTCICMIFFVLLDFYALFNKLPSIILYSTVNRVDHYISLQWLEHVVDIKDTVIWMRWSPLHTKVRTTSVYIMHPSLALALEGIICIFTAMQMMPKVINSWSQITHCRNV